MNTEPAGALQDHTFHLPRWWFVPVAAAVLALAACDDPGAERAAERAALSETATALPPGVRQQWFYTLDQEIEERLSIYKGRIRIRGDFGGVTYAPITALQVECSPLEGIKLIAPPRYGDDENSINLIRTRGDELGVGLSSPAAISLMDDLCRHLVDRLEAMIARASAEKP